MNQEKIGKFIQEKRREKEFTQIELAEKLGVSNRSISKWETGRCLPDYSVLPALCDELGITINELLSGEELTDENYSKKLEENIIGTIEYNNKKRNKKIKKTIFLFVTFLVIYLLYKAFIVYFYFNDWRSEDEIEKTFPNAGNIETLNIKENYKANTSFYNHDHINIFVPDEFELITDKARSSYVQDYCDYYAKNLIDDSNVDAGILICSGPKSNLRDNIRDQYFPYINKNNLYEKYNLSSELDLFKYYEKHANDKHNIFTSSDKVKMDYIARAYVEYSFGSYRKFYYLENDINGYLLDYSYENKSTYHAFIQIGSGSAPCILEISFFDRNENYFDLDKVVEIIGSIYR